MLRKVQLNIKVENINIYKGITVKAFLNSSTTGIFMDKKIAARYEFRLQKLEKLITVRNIDGINNSEEAITYQIEVNVYYKNYIEKIRIDVCDLEKTNVILDMLQL